jgi:glyoxylase-like metal-dependent hydrolase (beta-lactamase superfamily II)
MIDQQEHPHQRLPADRAAEAWFYTRAVADGVWLIAEPQHVYTWLVAGADRAVLLDTGMGILPIKPIAEKLTIRPLSVVNTHYHFDHVGGNYEFADIAIHELGAPLLERDYPRELCEAYLEYAHRQLEAAKTYRSLDREFFWLLSPESDPRPLPESFDESSWKIASSKATSVLADGEQIDLGDRQLTVIFTPGHSPDCICLLDERTGLLFGGDTINAGPIYAHFPDSDIGLLAQSTARLAELEESVRVVTSHHFGRPLAEPYLLREIADGVRRVELGDVPVVKSHDVIGGAMVEARFEHFSVSLPDPGPAGPES